jgi:hypothetical protein
MAVEPIRFVSYNDSTCPIGLSVSYVGRHANPQRLIISISIVRIALRTNSLDMPTWDDCFQADVSYH